MGEREMIKMLDVEMLAKGMKFAASPPKLSRPLHRQLIQLSTKIVEMSSYQPKLRSIYRRILRELPSPPAAASHSRSKPSILSNPSSIQQRIRSSFNSPRTTTSPDHQIQEAEQFAFYLKSQRTYATLVERYNPGMNMDDEERTRLTARRVGMEMPVEFDIKNGDGKE
jgi:ATP synthase assembly factor FMC1